MVIDKVDKPELPPSYKIRQTVETRGEKHQKQQDERREEDEYSASSGVKGWQKFHTDAKNRKALKLRTQDIAKLTFNTVTLQKGLIIIDADVEIINGQIFKNAFLFSTKMETYWNLNKFKQGQEIVINDFIKEPYVEISVIHSDGQVRTSSKDLDQTTTIKRTRDTEETISLNTGKKASKKISLWPLVYKETNDTNWFAVSFYLVIIFLTLFVIILTL